jgi:hypothetical protein
MPPKTVKCEICEQQVMKAQTLAYKTGRACRIHSGVFADSKQRQMQEKQNRDDAIKKLEKKHQPKEYVPLETRMNVCWKCGCQGTDLGTYYLQCAVAMEKMQLVGAEFNFFGMPNKIRDFIPKEFQTPMIKIFFTKDRKDIIERLKYKYRTVAEFAQAIQVCPLCLKVLGLEKQFQEESRKRMEGLTMKTAFMLGSLLKPELQAIAIDQLYDETIKEKGA